MASLTLKDIEQRLQPQLSEITSSLLSRGFICEGEFTSINIEIWKYNTMLLIEYLENETNLNLSYTFDDEYNSDNYILFNCDQYTNEEAKIIPSKIYL